MGRVKYYWYKKIRWASWALAEELQCKVSEIPERLEAIKNARKAAAGNLPTPEEARETAKALGADGSAPKVTGGESVIVVTMAHGEVLEFPTLKAVAAHFNRSAPSVSHAIKRGEWEAIGIDKIEKVTR